MADNAGSDPSDGESDPSDDESDLFSDDDSDTSESDDDFDPSELFLYVGEGSVPRNVRLVEVDRSVKFIPDELFQPRTFQHYRQLESVLLHEGLLGIGIQAFRQCHLLRIIQLPSTVTEIGKGAFALCSNLAAVELPCSMREIPDNLFESCRQLESVLLHEGLLKIGRHSFAHCSSLRNIQIPSTVTEIGQGAFFDCSSLEAVEIPEGLEEIEDWAFKACSSLEEVRIPASVARIGHYAFAYCTNLASTQLCEGLRTIGIGAFQRCSSLESLWVPSSVVEIEPMAFCGCSSLSSVRLHEDHPTMRRGAFRECPVESFRFVRLSERSEAMRLDDQTKSMLDSRLREITLTLKRVHRDEDWTLWDEEEEEETKAVQEKCKESLGRAHEFLTYLELKGAVSVLELALWKAKIEGKGVEEVQGVSINNGDGGQDLSDAGGERKRPKLAKNIGQDTRLSREECRVKCGADIVIPEVLKFFAYSSSWPRLDDSEEGNVN